MPNGGQRAYFTPGSLTRRWPTAPHVAKLALLRSTVFMDTGLGA
jgi:hypothetical protein